MSSPSQSTGSNAYPRSNQSDQSAASQSGQAGESATAADQSAGSQKTGKSEKGGNLPATGSELPLLGLLGFASTLAGIYLRK